MTEDDNDVAGNLFGTDAAWEVPAMGLNMPTGGIAFSESEPITGFEMGEGGLQQVHSPSQGEPGYREQIPNTVDPAELVGAISDFYLTTSGIADGINASGNLATWATPAEEPHVVVEETEEARQRRITEEVQLWSEYKDTATMAVANEREARAKLAATCFPTPKKGTQRFALPAGWFVKLVHGWNYKIGLKDKIGESGLAIPVYDQIVELEGKITKLGAEGSLLAGRLIRWVPELVEAEYLRLAADNATDVEVEAKGLIDELLTVTEKSPTLELEPPKPPKA